MLGFAISLYIIASYYSVPVEAAHASVADLQPEWSSANTNIAYSVGISNTAGDKIDEVRIYKNSQYSNFVCDPEPGWELLFINVLQACFYVANSSSPDYDPIDMGETADFGFSATSPPPGQCNLLWKFETRDDQFVWQFINDTTSVDDTPPVISKTVGDPKKACSQGENCDYYINQSTVIDLSATDPAEQGQCPASGIDYCRYRYFVDGQLVKDWINWDPNGFSFSFPEDSTHLLEVECVDMAGNSATLTETDIVDTDPPVTTKTYGTPFVTDGTYDWITSATPIDLDAIDPQPHPAGVDKLFWRNTVLTQVADADCVAACKFDGDDYGAGAWNEVQGDHITITKPEESCHLIEFYSVDMLGNTEAENRQCVFVDNSYPLLYKTVGDPKVGTQSEFIMIGTDALGDWQSDANTGANGARLYVTDGTQDIAAVFVPVDIELGSITSLSFWQKLAAGSGSFGANIILGVDADGDGIYESNDLAWHIGPTQHQASALGDDSFVEMDGVGPSGTYSQVDAYNTAQWWTPDLAGTGFDSCYTTLPGLVASCTGAGHRLDATDKVKYIRLLLGGSSSWNDIEIILDTLELNGVTVLDEPLFIGASTPIDLVCVDPQPHPVNSEEIYWRYDIDQNPQGQFSLYTGTITFPTDSNHYIEYYCKDELGNQGPLHFELDVVDATPPTIIKTVGQPQVGNCPPLTPQDQCYIQDHVTPITFDVNDNGPHISGVDYCDWSYTVDDVPTDSGTVDDVNGMISGFQIIFPEDSVHVLTFTCYDNLGNSASDIETFLVDSIPPVTTKSYDLVFTSYGSEWITNSTNITFAAQDQQPHPVGLDKTFYRITLVDDQYCQGYPQLGIQTSNCYYVEGTGSFIEYTGGNVNIPEESCHLIEFYSTDLLGNTEIQQRQCPFVDNTPPLTTKTMGTPNVPCDPQTQTCHFYINQQTPITLDCADQQPHPVDHETLYWRDYLSNETAPPFTSEPTGSVVIYKNEDSEHILEWYCADALGNTEAVQQEIDIVDTQPPEITKTIVGPQYGQCPPPNQQYFGVNGNGPPPSNCTIDGVTEIHVDVSDPQPHPVDGVSCDWKYYVVETQFYSNVTHVTPPFVINFPEESTHVLEITCEDALGNYVTDVETFMVDKTPPETTKTYGTPFFTDQVSDWATSQTSVTLAATDSVGQHDTGVSTTQYRVTLLPDDSGCLDNAVCQQQAGSGSWQSYLSPFSAPQESCHLIEYYSVDGVNKTETVKKQCVFIDNTAPLPNKTIGEPKVVWDGADAIFYNLAGKCWNNQSDSIDCWKVTMFTPVTLDCTDPQPHPVEHENVCFNVELDTVDETQSYCSNLGGEMQGNGYCCILGEEAPFTLYFSEESEHNLKFYCTDALNNTGPVDDEKFKVEGTPFKVPLKFKWNLVSVPFVLLDDDVDVVFKDIKDDIDSVWTYDQGQWYVWTPGPAPDTLTNIQPGWGYWVLAKNDTDLIIGGSLFNPAKTPPSKNLASGWNLVGYYGVQWQDFETVDPFCGEQEESFSSRSFCSLASLVDTQQGFPRWSSIWGFNNCVSGPDTWTAVQTCGVKPWDRMFAGKGYWLEIDVPEIYAPPTTCVWNNQNICVNQPNLP